jgi:hypothetical protein
VRSLRTPLQIVFLKILKIVGSLGGWGVYFTRPSLIANIKYKQEDVGIRVNVPVVYMARYIMVLRLAITFTRGALEGLGRGN